MSRKKKFIYGLLVVLLIIVVLIPAVTFEVAKGSIESGAVEYLSEVEVTDNNSSEAKPEYFGMDESTITEINEYLKSIDVEPIRVSYVVVSEDYFLPIDVEISEYYNGESFYSALTLDAQYYIFRTDDGFKHIAIDYDDLL